MAALVQNKTADSSSSPISIAFTSNVTAGNMIFVAVLSESAGAAGAGYYASSITDNQGNTYNQITTNRNASFSACGDVWYAYNAKGGATTLSVTITAAYAGYHFGVLISEYSGISTTAPLDKFTSSTGYNGGTPSSASSGATATTTQASETIIGVISDAAQDTITAGTGYGDLFTDSAFGHSFSQEDKFVSSTGAQTATFGGVSQGYVCFVATFKNGSAPAAQYFPTMTLTGVGP